IRWLFENCVVSKKCAGAHFLRFGRRKARGKLLSRNHGLAWGWPEEHHGRQQEEGTICMRLVMTRRILISGLCLIFLFVPFSRSSSKPQAGRCDISGVWQSENNSPSTD